jgi:chemotaxis protein methyltransferase CheR
VTATATHRPGPASHLPAVRAISEREFQCFRRLIYREAGINLGEGKQALVSGRLAARLRALNLTTYGAYYDRVAADPDGEMVRMLDAICTNETEFFREPAHFELLERQIGAEWEADAEAGRRLKRVRVWSAACSSGEEPYTLAMVLLRRFPPESGWLVEVVASDLSTRVLDRARSAVWPIRKANAIPTPYRQAFMLKGGGPQEGLMKAGPELRGAITFHRVNLAQEPYPRLGEFDLIFCRNVLIYFDAEGRSKVVGRLLRHLKPAGYVFLGHSEGLTGAGHPLRSVTPSVYTPIGRPDGGSRWSRPRKAR